jgi:hypothetical protein
VVGQAPNGLGRWGGLRCFRRYAEAR